VLGGRRLVLRRGRWLAVYVLGYGIGRLWVESLRIDVATEFGGLRVNTWISLLAIAGGLLWLFWGGNPVDAEATAELRAGGDPQAHVGARGGTLVDLDGVSDADLHRAAQEIEPDAVEPQRSGEPDDDPPAEAATSADDDGAQA
jgi:hypothetical protein